MFKLSKNKVADEKVDSTRFILLFALISKKFEFILINFPETDYAIDSSFKLDLIIDQLAAKEMSIARYYMKIQKIILLELRNLKLRLK